MGAKVGKLCAAGGVKAAAGSVLDRVISQPDSEAHTVLYKLADYKKGGLLLETYARGGMAAAERLIREEFSSYMYVGGRGRVINRAEYLRWKFRDQEQVVLPIEASLSPHDPLAKWEDHTACWQMCYRGALGESLLHVLIICDTKIHTRLARTLVKCFPKLSLDVVEGEEYLGASSLHLAIAYSNNELAQDLVEAGANVHQRAIGSFFLPRDQQKVPPARQTNYEGLAYLGEYPLAWAACCANEAVYNLLLDSDADPDSQDSFGNMILHMVVVCDKLDMFGYALRHPKVPASNGRMNKAGFTPLTLACQLGRSSVFREMLELSAKEFWRYSNITCSAYPLNALDTLLPDGRTNWNSALFIILNGTKQEHLNMLDGGIIQRLLEEKWNTFANKKFLKRLMILMLHLLLLSLSVYLRHSALEAEDHPNWGMEVIDARGGVRISCEIGTIISTLCYIILQQGDELKNQGLIAYIKQLIHEPAKFIFLMSNFLVLACIPARLSGQAGLEEALLIFLLPGSWFLLMFFAGAVKLTGPFVTMIYSMITGDMFTFGIIYCIILFGFSQSFFFLYRGFPDVQSTLFSSYPSTWMALFQITLGDYSYSDLARTTYPNLAKTVFAVFMVFVPILLLNMLIAMMGNTYAHVIEQSEKEWVKQWAKIVVSLERSVAQEDAHRYLQEYSIGLGPSDDPRYEQRAVMVIKSKAKTRAKQRKGALTNWKRVGRVTIAELRRRGITGEDLRRLMWGRASISSPTKAPLVRAPPPDCVAGAAGAAGGVGSALTSALNVMAFTELDFVTDPTQKQPTPDLLVTDKTKLMTTQITTSTTLVTQTQLAPTKAALDVRNTAAPTLLPVTGTVTPSTFAATLPATGIPGVTAPMSTVTQSTLGVPVAATGMMLGVSPVTPGVLGPPPMGTVGRPAQMMPAGVQQLPGVGMIQDLQKITIQPAAPPPEQVFRDFFLELVQLSEAAAPDAVRLRELAGRAADQTGVPEIDINLNMQARSARKMVAGAVSGLFGVAADAPAADSGWRRERQDHSDSDPISGKMVAGAVSGLFGVAADAPAADSGWRRERQDHSDSDPISGKMVAGAVSGLFGVAADAPAADSGWRRERQDHSDSDPISGKMVAGAVSGLFGVAADAPAADSGWRRERQDHSDSDPISGKMVAGAVSGLFGVAADAPAADSGWRRERQDHSDSDPISGKMVAGAVSGLFGVAADAPAADSGWRRERQDHSDSDPISESVLLGRASRARRARSASRRAAPPPPHLYVPARSMYLVASESSAVESDAPLEQASSGNNSAAIEGRRDDAARIRAARPICIQHATGQAPQVEHSLYIAGLGSGVEVDSAAPAQLTMKHEKKRIRPKTARQRRNRVSPVPEPSTPGSPLEHWATAPLSRLSRLIRSSSASTASVASSTSAEASPKRY